MKKVVITGTVGVVTPEIIDTFKQKIISEVPDATIEFLYDLPVDDDQLIKNAKGANVIISQYQRMNENIYKALTPELRGYVANGIGTNAADEEAATNNGVIVANVPDYCQEEVANHALTLILACNKRMNKLTNFVKSGNWAKGNQFILDKKRFSENTVGLYGFGKIPRKLAEMLNGFGVKIISHDPFVGTDIMENYGVTPVTFEEMLEQSDYISIHAPLVPSTEGIFNDNAFMKMKKSACLINTSRGGLINAEALYNALTNGEIDYAALDVFISEPPSGIEKDLIELDNVIATPHISYYSSTAMEELIDKVASAASKLLMNKKPESVTNKAVLEKVDWIEK